MININIFIHFPFLAVLVSAVNVVSVRATSLVQDTFTVMKTVALLIIIVVGIVELSKGKSAGSRGVGIIGSGPVKFAQRIVQLVLLYP